VVLLLVAAAMCATCMVSRYIWLVVTFFVRGTTANLFEAYPISSVGQLTLSCLSTVGTVGTVKTSTTAAETVAPCRTCIGGVGSFALSTQTTIPSWTRWRY